jgi:hypothetical protein
LPPADAGRPGRVSRRHFLAATAATGAAGLGLSGWAFGPEATTVALTRHDVLVPGLVAGLEGLRIAQVSDVHLPANPGAARVRSRCSTERPEIVILTGDIVESHDALDDLIAFAQRARYGWHVRGDGKLGTLRGHRAGHGAQGLRGGRRAIPLQ